MSLMRDYTDPKPALRAKGNLNYLQFIELVKRIWIKAHPKIPMVPSGADDPAIYPCIVYSLQLRKTHPGEPKMRYREEKNNQEDVYVVGGQRFQNIVYFQAVGEAQHVDTIEHLIEVFEDFMMEFTPVFKELGVSELVYARRLSDREEQRPGANTRTRTVSYMVTTEKVVATRYDRLREIVITARTWLDDLREYYEPGTIYDSSPRYHLSGPNAVLRYQLRQANLDSATSFSDLEFLIPGTNFRINDRIYVMPSAEQEFLQGFYRIKGFEGDPYDVGRVYELVKDGGSSPEISGIVAGTGEIYYMPEDVSVDIVDEKLRLNPDN